MDESFENRVAATERMLIDSCHQSGFIVTGDQRISEKNAAVLLGMAQGSLANKRSSNGEPRAYRLPVGGGEKVSYRIHDLALYIETKLLEKDLF